MAAWPVRKVRAPSIVPAAVRIACVCPFASAGSSSETIWAAITLSVSGVTEMSFPVGNSAVARSAAARASGRSDAAGAPSLCTTKVNDPVERWPKWSRRTCSARCESVPGSVKRLVSRSARREAAVPATTNATIQMPRTMKR